MVDRILTFEQTPVKRPGEADVLDGEKENATPTVPPHMPNAEEFMQMARQIVALAAMVPLLRMSVEFTGITPTIHSFACVRSDAVSGSFTLTRTGVGVVEITWGATFFPAPNTKPSANTNWNADGRADAVPITNGVRIRTFDGAGAAADIPFTVAVH